MKQSVRLLYQTISESALYIAPKIKYAKFTVIYKDRYIQLIESKVVIEGEDENH